jgi:hypothetical protein
LVENCRKNVIDKNNLAEKLSYQIFKSLACMIKTSRTQKGFKRKPNYHKAQTGHEESKDGKLCISGWKKEDRRFLNQEINCFTFDFFSKQACKNDRQKSITPEQALALPEWKSK